MDALKSGNFKDLVNYISDNAGIEFTDVVKNIPLWLNFLSDKQRKIIRKYYFHRKSIFSIRIELDARTNTEIERCLTSGIKKLVKIAKENSI